MSPDLNAEAPAATALLGEIGRVLGLPANSDPAILLDTVRKLEKVVKAVPRMENFIHNVSVTMSEDEVHMKPLALDKVLPLLTHWKAIVK